MKADRKVQREIRRREARRRCPRNAWLRQGGVWLPAGAPSRTKPTCQF
jgi:hypothetical protein